MDPFSKVGRPVRLGLYYRSVPLLSPRFYLSPPASSYLVDHFPAVKPRDRLMIAMSPFTVQAAVLLLLFISFSNAMTFGFGKKAKGKFHSEGQAID